MFSLRSLILLLVVFFTISASLPVPMIPRESRALAPSVESWCIFYPEKCRMLRFAGIRKRDLLDDIEY